MSTVAVSIGDESIATGRPAPSRNPSRMPRSQHSSMRSLEITTPGLDTLISAIAASDGSLKEDLRRAVVGVLDGLGVEHPVARESRRKLASALY